jgi:acyl carrier protein
MTSRKAQHVDAPERTPLHDEIADILCEQLNVDEDECTLDARIGSDLGADSLDCVEVGMAIEEKFNIPEEGLDESLNDWYQNDGTVQELLAIVEKARPKE